MESKGVDLLMEGPSLQWFNQCSHDDPLFHPTPIWHNNSHQLQLRVAYLEIFKINLIQDGEKTIFWLHDVEETAKECRRLGATAYAFMVDCSKKEDIYKTAEKVKEEIGDVSILMNNAGVVAPTDVLSTDDHDIQRTFEVNILAHFWTIKAFLPAMMRNNHGHIVTVASAGGHIVAPFLVTYCSSKFAAVGFHRALTQELSVLGKDGVKTSCVCPMFIKSGFVKNPSSRIMAPMEPEEVAKQLMKGILTNEKMILIPPFLKFSIMMDRFLPARAAAAFWKLIQLKFDYVVGYKDKEK